MSGELDLVGLDLILQGQEPLFEGRSLSSINKASWFTSASELLASGLDYFGPVARKRRHRVTGFSKDDVAETTNVVWMDFDPPSEVDISVQASLVERAERNVNLLVALGMEPSVVVFSGRGHWCYWKLKPPISQEDAESLMRRLYAQYRHEGSERDIGRIARLPGSVNEKTGFTAYVMSVSGVVWEPEELGELLPDLEPDEAASVVGSDVTFDPSLKPGGKLPVIELSDGLAGYLKERPSKKERKKRGIDGSSLEQSIINRLVNQGYSDSQIAFYFDQHRLPRHMAEKARRRGSYSWLARSIAVSRARLSSSSSSSVDSSPPTVSIGNRTYFDAEEQEAERPRQLGWSGRRWWILYDLPEGESKQAVVAWVMKTFAIRRTQARTDLDWLEEKKLIEEVRDKSDGRIKRVCRTSEASQLVAKRERRKGPPLSFLKGMPTATPTPPAKQPPAPAASRNPPKAKPKRSSRQRDTEEKARRKEILRRQRGLINDVYRLHIHGRSWTYFQPITPIRDWKKVLLHVQLPVADDDIGLVYQSFISPRDTTLGDPAAHDPIEERTLQSNGYPARDKYVGLVAEAVPVDDGFAVAFDQRDGVSVPRIGLVVQAKTNFYDKLRSGHTGVYAVRKRGQRRDTFYEVERYTDTITIPPHSLDLDAIITELADPERAQRVLASLPTGWHFNRY